MNSMHEELARLKHGSTQERLLILRRFDFDSLIPKDKILDVIERCNNRMLHATKLCSLKVNTDQSAYFRGFIDSMTVSTNMLLSILEAVEELPAVEEDGK